MIAMPFKRLAKGDLIGFIFTNQPKKPFFENINLSLKKAKFMYQKGLHELS